MARQRRQQRDRDWRGTENKGGVAGAGPRDTRHKGMLIEEVPDDPEKGDALPVGAREWHDRIERPITSSPSLEPTDREQKYGSGEGQPQRVEGNRRKVAERIFDDGKVRAPDDHHQEEGDVNGGDAHANCELKNEELRTKTEEPRMKTRNEEGNRARTTNGALLQSAPWFFVLGSAFLVLQR
jgi:hypothetical protein